MPTAVRDRARLEADEAAAESAAIGEDKSFDLDSIDLESADQGAPTGGRRRSTEVGRPQRLPSNCSSAPAAPTSTLVHAGLSKPRQRAPKDDRPEPAAPAAARLT
jgi:hypothetical protein